VAVERTSVETLDSEYDIEDDFSILDYPDLDWEDDEITTLEAEELLDEKEEGHNAKPQTIYEGGTVDINITNNQ
jgi:hypothetical protein